MKKFTTLLFLVLGAAVYAAPKLHFTAGTNKEPLAYKCGEEIVFSLQITDGKTVQNNIPFRWELFVEGGKSSSGKAVSSADNPLQIKTKLDKPGFAYVFAYAVDEKGKARKDVLQLSASAGAEVGKITQSIPEPKDFDAYWKKQLERLKAVPMAVKLTPVKSEYKNVDCFYFEIAAPGENPATGYLSIPKNAKPGKHKAYVFFYGYKFDSIPKQDRTASYGNISLSVSRYGIPQGMDKNYYKKAGETTLKKFGFRNNAKADECDFNYMILRDLRAIEYLKSRTEWNRRDLTVNGGSMGAFQSINVAALDKDVTAVQARIPWCANLGGVKFGRLRGWRPDHVPSLDYFDIVNQAKRIKAKTEIYIGLGDRACPASGQFAMYNVMTCPKELTYQQTGGHRTPSPEYKNIRYVPAK